MSSMSLTMTVGPSATRTSDLFLSSLAPIVHLIGLCTFSSPPFHYLALPSFLSLPPFNSLALPSFSSPPCHYLALSNFLGEQVQCRHATFNSAVNHSLDKVSIINYMR